MGLDVQIWARGIITDEQIAHMKEAFAERMDGFAWWAGESPEYGPEGGERIVELPSMVRFYGEGYERGPWPEIYAAIMLFRSCFPGSVVSYASDSSYPEDGDMEATDDTLAATWAHWLSPHWDDYHRDNRLWAERRAQASA